MSERVPIGGEHLVPLEQLEKRVKDLGVTFPEKWNEFSEQTKRAAIKSYASGGLTDLGFSTLTPDYLEQNQEIRDRARAELDEIDEIERRRRKGN